MKKSSLIALLENPEVYEYIERCTKAQFATLIKVAIEENYELNDFLLEAMASKEVETQQTAEQPEKVVPKEPLRVLKELAESDFEGLKVDETTLSQLPQASEIHIIDMNKNGAKIALRIGQGKEIHKLTETTVRWGKIMEIIFHKNTSHRHFKWLIRRLKTEQMVLPEPFKKAA